LIEASLADLRRLFSDDEAVDKLQVSLQEAILSHTLEEQHAKLAEYQTELDRLRRQRRRCLEMREEFEERGGEIAQTLERFGLLASAYESDVERLEALEEGAAALMAGAQRPCPLCGAEPEHQHEVHGLDHVERSRRAVAAEISKIRVKRADLGKATASLRAEGEGLAARITRLSGQITELEGAIE
jgi:DNA repair exonuclease SbcCD ATPase subunit